MAFRPFFLTTALAAIFFPMYLVTTVVNGYPYPGELFDVVSWHGHELLFGLSSSLFAGFLLTASSHWTGKKPMQGFPLFAFLLLWIFIRIILWLQPNKYLLLIIAPTFLIILIVKMLFILKGNRNFAIVNGLLTLLLSGEVSYLYGKMWMHPFYVETGITLGLASIFLLITVFSGRLIPFFTNSRFKETLITPSAKLEMTCFYLTLLTFASDIFFSTHYPLLVAIFFLFLALCYTVRQTELYHPRMLEESMLIPFIFAHLWLPTFAFIRSYELLAQNNQLGRPSIHALLVGGLGLFSVTVMSRASLGHTGRKIAATKFLKTIFVLIFLGALLRVFLPMLTHDVFDGFLHVSMGTWTLGYIFFAIKFGPMYFKPRADQ